jgi:hypothetical protein
MLGQALNGKICFMVTEILLDQLESSVFWDILMCSPLKIEALSLL